MLCCVVVFVGFDFESFTVYLYFSYFNFFLKKSFISSLFQLRKHWIDLVQKKNLIALVQKKILIALVHDSTCSRKNCTDLQYALVQNF